MTVAAHQPYGGEITAVDVSAAGLDPRAAAREWMLFWLLVVPQILVAGAVLSAGIPTLALPFACVPVLLGSLANPFIGIATLFAVLPFDELLGVYGAEFSLSKVIGIFVFAGFAMRAGRRGYSLLPAERVTKATTALATVILVSTMWSDHPGVTVTSAVTPLLLAGLTLIGAQVIDSRHRWEIILTAMLISGLVVGAMFTFRIGGLIRVVSSQERMGLGEANQNHTGRILVAATAAGIAMLFYSRRRLVRLATLAAFPLMLFGILLTKSRSAELCYPFSLGAGILLGLRTRLMNRFLLIAGAAAVAVGAFFVAGTTGVLDTKKIFSRWTGGFGEATSARTYIAETGLDIWTENAKNMLLGIGYGMFHFEYTEEAGRQQRFGAGTGRDPHNMWIKTLTETGILGVAVLSWVSITLIISALRTAPGYAFVSWALVALLALAVLSSSLIYHKWPWYFVMLVAATARVFPRETTSQPDDALLTDYHRVRGLG